MIHLGYAEIVFWGAVLVLVGALCGIGGFKQFLEQQVQAPLYRALLERDRARADLTNLRCDYKQVRAELSLAKTQLNKTGDVYE